jgi:hypothetical protein
VARGLWEEGYPQQCGGAPRDCEVHVPAREVVEGDRVELCELRIGVSGVKAREMAHNRL